MNDNDNISMFTDKEKRLIDAFRLGFVLLLLLHYTGILETIFNRDIEREIKTIENNNRELAERASNLSRRIGKTAERIGKSAADVGQVRKELGNSTERVVHITDGVSRVSEGIGSSIGKAQTAERIIEECIELVEEIEKQQQTEKHTDNGDKRGNRSK